MLRAIFFLDCDFCHESHSDIRSMTDRDDTTWSFVEGDLLESAFGNGWSHCLMEDTGEYKLMCGSCHCALTFKMHRDDVTDDIEF